MIHLTGPYRSGSTYAALLLNNHPELAIGLHTTNWPRERHGSVGEAVDYAVDRLGLEHRPAFNPYTKLHQRWRGALRGVLDFSDGQIVGEKTNLEAGFQPTFLDWFPNGHALTVIRDPRSIVASFREYTYHDDDTYLQAAFVALRTLQLVREHEASLPDDRYRTIRYETLAMHPEAELRRITDWLGLDWPGADVMTSTDGWQDVPGVQWEDRSSFSDPGDIDRERAVHRWKGHLSDEERKFVEWVCWDAMDDFGYETSYQTRPCPIYFSDFVREARENAQVAQMLDHWHATGEGTEAFPGDPTDETTWRESNREEVA